MFNKGWSDNKCSFFVFYFILEVDTCVSSPCMNGATCVNTKESYCCDCAPGYNGVNCENEINECLSSPCYQASTCVNKVFQMWNHIHRSLQPQNILKGWALNLSVYSFFINLMKNVRSLFVIIIFDRLV